MSASDALVKWLCRPNIPLFGQPLGAFRLHPDVLAGVLMLIGAYLVAYSALRKRSGVTPKRRHTIYLSLAVLCLLIAEVSPLHDLAEGYLFSAHMVQHMFLVYLLPCFLLNSLPPGMLEPLFRRPVALKIGKVLTNPVVAIIAGNAVYALWHLPPFYQAALFRHEIHVLEHILMVGTAIMMWWPIFSPSKELPRLPATGRILYLLLMSLPQIGVFAYITFSNKIVYRFYASAPRLWGVSPEADQVLSGIIMKLGMGGVIVAVLTYTFFQWARREEAEDPSISRSVT